MSPRRISIYLAIAAMGCAEPAAVVGETTAALLREECTIAFGELDIDVPRIAVSGQFRLNGAVPPTFPNQTAIVELRSKTLGTVLLGELHTGSYSRVILPGVYDVVYRRVAGSQVPANAETVLARGVSFTSDTVHDIDVPAVTLTGEITLNGAAPPASVYERGELRLRDRATGATFSAGSTLGGSYSVLVIPGEYDVLYARQLGGTIVPLNGAARIVENVAVVAATVLDVDIPVVAISGAIRINGAPAPTSVYENATLSLRDTVTGDLFLLGQTRHQSYSAKVVPGVYDVIYSYLIGATIVPRNEAAAIMRNVAVTTGGNLDVDVPVVTLQGALTLDGGAFPQSSYNRAAFSLQGAEVADVFRIGKSQDGSYSVRIVPGRYSVVYESLISTGLIPENPWKVLSTGHKIVKPLDWLVPVGVIPGHEVFAPPVVLDVNVSSGVVAAEAHIWGEPAYASVYEMGLLIASDGAHDVDIGQTRHGASSVRLVAGKYQLRYSHLIGHLVPANSYALVGAASTGLGAKPVVVDLEPGTLAGDFRQAGFAFPANEAQRGRLSLRARATGDVVELGSTSDRDYERTLLGGTYDVVYDHVEGNEVVANRGARLGCVTYSPLVAL